MKKIIHCFIICFLLAGSIHAQSNDEKAIVKILFEQDVAWNSGNINDFMKGYWKNDSLMFIGKSGITYGWQQTLDNYKKRYPDTTAMGKLNFEYIEMKQLSPDYFFVVGKWHLTRTIGNLDGAFTLLLKKINNIWVIVKDHSS
jgi:hypothetical protein